MSQIVHTRMEAAIAGDQVTLTPEAGGVSESQPPDWKITQIVVTTATNPAQATYWQAAATGARYEVKITRLS